MQLIGIQTKLSTTNKESVGIPKILKWISENLEEFRWNFFYRNLNEFSLKIIQEDVCEPQMNPSILHNDPEKTEEWVFQTTEKALVKSVVRFQRKIMSNLLEQVEQLLPMLLMTSAICNSIAAFVCAWYVLLLWSNRFAYAYAANYYDEAANPINDGSRPAQNANDKVNESRCQPFSWLLSWISNLTLFKY